MKLRVVRGIRVYGLTTRWHPVRTGDGRWVMVSHEWQLIFGIRGFRVSPRFGAHPDFLRQISKYGA